MASKATTGDKKKASTRKKKDRPSSSSKDRDKAKSSSKSGAKKSSSRSKSAAAALPPASGKADELLSAAPPPVPHDPDAVQLFRRYDRARAGVLTRLDFLQLLRDYADPSTVNTSAGGSGLHEADILYARRATLQRARKPLSLTDTSGIPLGYERSDKNSEFEAGQLFERYDKDRTGALTLDKFHGFFADFKPQLTAFVEDLNYQLIPHLVLPTATAPSRFPSRTETLKPQPSPATPPSTEKPPAGATTNSANEHERRKTLSSNYQAALWKLRKLCKDELVEQRERILEMITSIRETIASEQRGKHHAVPSSRWQQHRPFQNMEFRNRGKPSPHTEWPDHGDSENQVFKLYEAMEEDLERIDDIESFVRRYSRKGAAVSVEEMESFLKSASDLQEQAQYLAMKDYTVPRGMSKLGENDTLNRQQQKQTQLTPTSSSVVKKMNSVAHEKDSPDKHLDGADGGVRSNIELSQLLRVKDQMIYQLLLERTEMRKQKASMESYLQELSDVSTAEMKKWARLTDEMQVEIEQLRIKARRNTSR